MCAVRDQTADREQHRVSKTLEGFGDEIRFPLPVHALLAANAQAEMRQMGKALHRPPPVRAKLVVCDNDPGQAADLLKKIPKGHLR